MAAQFQILECGTMYTEDYRIFYKDNGKFISPMHDIPLAAGDKEGVYHMVVEIPRWTNAKMEIAVKEPMNPIKQDVKKGKIRFVANVFPHKGYIWNYGAFPQTWEDPSHIPEETGAKGDNDPLDVLEIGQRVAQRGEVLKVKVLGLIALIDEGETDWKIITINIEDPQSNEMNDIDDIERLMPGFIHNTVDWFRRYKKPDGKPENQFAFNGEPRGREFALRVLRDTHQYWKDLMYTKENKEPSRANTTLKESPYCIATSSAESFVSKQPTSGNPQPLDDSIDKWHYC